MAKVLMIQQFESVDTSDVTAFDFNELQQVSIYPNPASTQIRFALKANDVPAKRLRLYSAQSTWPNLQRGSRNRSRNSVLLQMTCLVDFYYLHITDAFQENTWTGSL